jgi:glycerol-3-phosphate dehydrogenase
MGRCQGGFCTLKLTEILGRELGIDEQNITKSGTGSELLAT